MIIFSHAALVPLQLFWQVTIVIVYVTEGERNEWNIPHTHYTKVLICDHEDNKQKRMGTQTTNH